jgi:hypothetical protein
MLQFEYMVCALQFNRVTFVNGDWQGIQPLDPKTPSDAFASCPTVWDFLQAAGQQGWELVTALEQTAQDNQKMQTLYLKRPNEPG